MAINPLLQEEFFELTGMYDDSVILDLYPKLKAKVYSNGKDSQGDMLEFSKYLGDESIYYEVDIKSPMTGIRYDALIKKLEIPYGSIIYSIPKLVIPILNKKIFVSKYGYSNAMFSVMDMYTRKDIFSKVFNVQFDKFRIKNIYFARSDGNESFLIIKNDASDGMARDNYDTMINSLDDGSKVIIKIDFRSTMYNIDARIDSIFNLIQSGGYYTATFSTSASNIIKIPSGIDNDNNYWDLYITENITDNPNRMIVTHATLNGNIGTNIVFNVPANTINSLRAINGGDRRLNFLFIRRDFVNSAIVYDRDNSDSNLVMLDYISNPNSPNTIDVYDFDVTTMIKGKKINGQEYDSSYFPNVYDMGNFSAYSHVCIERSEFNKALTSQSTYNPLEKLISSLGDELYLKSIKDNLLPDENGTNVLSTFSPTKFDYDLEEYESSEYYGNYRGFIADKIVKMMETDPSIYIEYYKWMNSRNKDMILRSGTPKDFNFGGSTRGGEFTGNNPVVTDTKFVNINPADAITFDEPHSYFRVKYRDKDLHINLFINGVYTPVYTKMYLGNLYVFIPVSQMDEAMLMYSDDSACRDALPITIIVYTRAYNNGTPIRETALINGNGTIVQFFTNNPAINLSFNDLVAYDANTLKMYNFQTEFSLIKDIYTITPVILDTLSESGMLTSEGVFISSVIEGGEIIYVPYITSQDFEFAAKDGDVILIQTREDGPDKSVSLEDFLESLVENGVYPTIGEARKKFLNRILDFNTTTFQYVGSEIYKQDIVFTSRNISYDMMPSEMTDTTLVFENAYIDIDTDSYILYVDGLDKTELYTWTPSGNYNDKIEITLKDGSNIDPNLEYRLVHSPIPFVKEEISFSTNEEVTENRVLYAVPANNEGIDKETIFPYTNIGTNGIILDFKGKADTNNPTLTLVRQDGRLLRPSVNNMDSNSIMYYNAGEYDKTDIDLVVSDPVILKYRPDDAGLIVPPPSDTMYTLLKDIL